MLLEQAAKKDNEKGTLQSVIDDTATNDTGAHNGATTALSVGMSPGGTLSMHRRGQRSEAFMFEQNMVRPDALGGGGNVLGNYESRTPNNFVRATNRLSGRPTRLVSTRRTDHKSRSGMPKTAINYYNLRKGLYLKNGN